MTYRKTDVLSRATFLVLSLIVLGILLAKPSMAGAACDSLCLKRRAVANAPVLGLTHFKVYITRRQRILFRTEKAAKAKGYVKRVTCLTGVATSASSRCTYPVGIKVDKTYVCLSGVRTFKKVSAATRTGYTLLSPCSLATPTPTPTPTSTPTVAPLPQSLIFDIEAGTRHTNIAVSSTVRLNNGTFRAYLGRSISSFEHKTIAYANSNDGLSFSAPINITGVIPDTYETLTYPAFFFLQNGNYGLMFEGIEHVGSAGIDMHTLNRMTSVYGSAFTREPEGSFQSNLSATLAPAVLRVDGSTLRVYYRDLNSIRTALSSDEGLTWLVDSQAVVLQGSSESYAYYPRSYSVIRLADGSYRMFFSAYPSSMSTVLRLFTAVSADAKTFRVETGTLFEPAESSYLLDRPDAVLLSNGQIRVYYGEYYQEQDTWVRNVKSAISR